MKKYFFEVKGIWGVRADSLEDALEELDYLISEFEDVTYSDEPIDIEEWNRIFYWGGYD